MITFQSIGCIFAAIMPIKTGLVASQDYSICKDIVDTLEKGDTTYTNVDDIRRCQKYIYELALKCRDGREFSSKKVDEYRLRITRII